MGDDIKQLLIDKTISMGHARALLGAKKPSELAKIVVKEALNVRQTEELVRNSHNKPTSSNKKAIKQIKSKLLQTVGGKKQ